MANLHTGTSMRQAAKAFNVPLGTLHNKIHHKHGAAVGGPKTLTSEEEDRLVSVLKKLSTWRFPVDQYVLKACSRETVVAMTDQFLHSQAMMTGARLNST